MKPIHLMTGAVLAAGVLTCDLIIEKIEPLITLTDTGDGNIVTLQNRGAELQLQIHDPVYPLQFSGFNLNCGGESEYFASANYGGNYVWWDGLAHRFYLNNELSLEIKSNRVTVANYYRPGGLLIQRGSTNVTLSTGFTLVFPEPYADTNYVATIIGSEPLFGTSFSDKTTNSCTFHYACVSAQIDWQVVR